MRPVEEIRADLAHCDRNNVPWPSAALRLLADIPDLLGMVQAVERIVSDIDSECPPDDPDWNRSQWWDAMDSVRTELRAALAAAADAPQPSAERCAFVMADGERCGRPAGHTGWPVGLGWPQNPVSPYAHSREPQPYDAAGPSPAVLPETTECGNCGETYPGEHIIENDDGLVIHCPRHTARDSTTQTHAGFIAQCDICAVAEPVSGVAGNPDKEGQR